MNVVEVGDYVTLPEWGGDYYKVAHVDYTTRRIFVEYTNESDKLDRMEYPLENNWIFRTKSKNKEMEDTREYLAALEHVYDRYFGL